MPVFKANMLHYVNIKFVNLWYALMDSHMLVFPLNYTIIHLSVSHRCSISPMCHPFLKLCELGSSTRIFHFFFQTRSNVWIHVARRTQALTIYRPFFSWCLIWENTNLFCPLFYAYGGKWDAKLAFEFVLLIWFPSSNITVYFS